MTKIDTLKHEQQAQPRDSFVADYDYINDDGDKINDRSYTDPELGEVEDKLNMSHLFQTCLSTTTDSELLVLEAKLLDEGRLDESSNPHIPATMEILEQAKGRMESRDLTPAWTVFDPSTVQPSSGADEATAD